MNPKSPVFLTDPFPLAKFHLSGCANTTSVIVLFQSHIDGSRSPAMVSQMIGGPVPCKSGPGPGSSKNYSVYAQLNFRQNVRFIFFCIPKIGTELHDFDTYLRNDPPSIRLNKPTTDAAGLN